MPARIRKRYDGTESDVLINGQFYTYNELAEASGITYKAITNRLGKRPFVTQGFSASQGSKAKRLQRKKEAH